MITTKKRVGTHTLYGIDRMLSEKKLPLHHIGESVNGIFCILDDEYRIQYINSAGVEWLRSSQNDIVPNGSIKIDNYLEEQIESPEYLIPGVTSELNSNVNHSLQKVWFPNIMDFKLCMVSKLFCEFIDAQLVTIMPLRDWKYLRERMANLIEDELFAESNLEKYESLTKREKEIIDLIAQGKNSREISDTLFISRHTVEQHRKNINKKLNVNSVAEIINFSHAFSSSV